MSEVYECLCAFEGECHPIYFFCYMSIVVKTLTDILPYTEPIVAPELLKAQTS